MIWRFFYRGVACPHFIQPFYRSKLVTTSINQHPVDLLEIKKYIYIHHVHENDPASISHLLANKLQTLVKL